MLTKKQKQVWDVVRRMAGELGYFPTVREIGREAGLSSSATVHAYLERFVEKGLLKKIGSRWAVETMTNHVPLMGIVPAGSPLEVFAALGEEIELPEWMVESGGEMAAFRVRGDSMKDAYIQDGDVVVVRQAPGAEPGEMVVALLHDASITLKRLKKTGEQYWLMPENPDYQPIYESFQLVGKVVGVLRRYR
jgi:repressor LexA